MTTVSFDVPEESLHAISATPERFARAVRLAAALYWHARGEITLGTGAALAGLSLAQFMHALKEAKQNTFAVDLEDFERELSLLDQRRARDAGSV